MATTNWTHEHHHSRLPVRVVDTTPLGVLLEQSWTHETLLVDIDEFFADYIPYGGTR